MQQAHQLNEGQDPAQQYVSSDELVRALASIETKQMGETADRLKIGDAIQQLGLDLTPEQVLAEVTAERERRSIAALRASRRRRSLTVLACFVSAVIVAAFLIQFLASHPAPLLRPRSPQPIAHYGPEFDSLINALRSNTFDPGKVTTLKMMAKGRKFTSEQVKAILGEFTFDEGRGQAARILYPLVTDPQNFYTVRSAFTFDAGWEQLIKDLGLDKP